jgi:Fic family protein
MVSDQRTSTEPWPRVEVESLSWESRLDGLVSRTVQRRARGPYEAAVPPPIARTRLSLPSDVAALVEEAAAEIARFDVEAGAEIAPFSAVLLRSESAASSKIENLTASARAIAEAELGARRTGNARLIVANTQAMAAAIDLAGSITEASILQMHEALLGASEPDIAGRWRDEQVWIGGSNHSPHGAAFVPPHHTRVRSAIRDLLRFIARDDVPVLAHAAVAHAQFETIHPFPDGNGRTGRALLHAQLRNKKLTRNVTVPVSAGLLVDTGAYFEALTAYRAGDPYSIIERLAHASFAAIGNGRQLATELGETRIAWGGRIKARKDSAAWRLVDLLFRNPVVNAALVAGELGIAQQNSYRHLETLVDAEVLVEFTDKRRNRLWRAPEVLDALDRFAARAGRRNHTGA